MESELLISRLKKQALARPNKVLFEFVDDNGVALAKRTYQEFEQETNQLARRLLRRRQKNASNIALLVYPPGIDFIIAFVACLRAGITAVPVYPPRGAKNKDLTMFLAVHASCKAKIALTNSIYNFASKVASMKDTLGSMFSRREAEEEGIGKWPDDLEWIVTDSLSGDMAGGEEIDVAKREDTAFLQYTSGSTSLPKGVVLSHGNLAHNLSTIITALKADESVVVVSWLPMYHDMGLIGSHLGTIYCGGTATIFSPLSFVKNPPLWIDLTSSRKATHLQAPNFAYRLTVRKFQSRQNKQQTIDLSSVRHIFNAAEPIDPSAMDEFCDVFGKVGLKREAMIPGYGLAEHTVYVCDGGKQRILASRKSLETRFRLELLNDSSNTDAMALVGCGSPPPSANIRILIVEPHSRRKLAEGCVGEIWLSSASKSSAYFGLEEKTMTDLRARLAMDGGEETKRKDSVDDLADGENDESRYISPSDDEFSCEWLRTGDLGVEFKQELFVCGRIKDMLIVRGRNHFPQDIEATVERADRQRIRPGCSAAFTVESSQGEVVVVCFEVRSSSALGPELDELINKVRTSVAKEHGISPRAVVLLAEHSIPKTTSGKISRHRVKQAYLGKKLKQVASWERAEGDDGEEGDDEQSAVKPLPTQQRTTLTGDALLEKLKSEAGSLLERDPVTMDAEAPLNELGFDSMMLTQFKGAVINVLGVELPDEQLFDEKCTLNKVREMIEEMPATGGAPVSATTGRDEPVPIPTARGKTEQQPLLGSWKPGQKCGFCGC